jgi:hypothetical protein
MELALARLGNGLFPGYPPLSAPELRLSLRTFGISKINYYCSLGTILCRTQNYAEHCVVYVYDCCLLLV